MAVGVTETKDVVGAAVREVRDAAAELASSANQVYTEMADLDWTETLELVKYTSGQLQSLFSK